jgi:hypothetical protein
MIMNNLNKKYIYRLLLPWGDESYHEGQGEIVQWPDSLISKAKKHWFLKWWYNRFSLLGYEEQGMFAKIWRKPMFDSDAPWETCFNWPIEKIWTYKP